MLLQLLGTMVLPSPTDTLNRMDALSPENINKNRVIEIIPGSMWGHLTTLHQIIASEDRYSDSNDAPYFSRAATSIGSVT